VPKLEFVFKRGCDYREYIDERMINKYGEVGGMRIGREN
jgi:hypothetical protein